MKLRLSLLVLIVFLSGCFAENEAKNAVKKLLNDPDSAQFSEVTNGKKNGDVCGFVNAKNRMGGYVGNTAFFYEKASGIAGLVQPVEDSEFRSLWLAIKGNSFSEELEKVMMGCKVSEMWGDTCTSPAIPATHPMCPALKKNGTDLYKSLQTVYDR